MLQLTLMSLKHTVNVSESENKNTDPNTQKQVHGYLYVLSVINTVRL